MAALVRVADFYKSATKHLSFVGIVPDSQHAVDLVIDMYRIEQKNHLLAGDLMLIDSYIPHCELYYRKYRGDKPINVREMVNILYNPNEGQEAPNTKKGLRWLIGRLNKNSPMINN